MKLSQSQINAGALVRAVLDVVDSALDIDEVSKNDFDDAIATLFEYSSMSSPVPVSWRAAALSEIATSLRSARKNAEIAHRDFFVRGKR